MSITIPVFYLQLQTPVDIFLSHDWPSRITEYGNRQALLSKKPFLRPDVSYQLMSWTGQRCTQAAHTRPVLCWEQAHLYMHNGECPMHPVYKCNATSAGSYVHFDMILKVLTESTNLTDVLPRPCACYHIRH